MIDGTVARRTNSASELGARLDMSRPKPNQKETLRLDLESLRTFFPDSTPKDMESAILRILTEWQKREQSKVQSRNSWDRDGR